MQMDTLAAIAIINARAASIDLKRQPLPGQSYGPGDKKVGTMTESMRRLYGAWMAISAEFETMRRTGEEQQAEVNAILGIKGSKLNYPTLVANAANPRLPALVNGILVMERRLQETNGLKEIAHGLFWFEARNAHPELWTAETVGIFDDWSLGIVAEKPEPEGAMDIESLLAGMAGGRGRKRGGLFGG